MSGQLEGVADGVAEVQGHAQTGVPLVLENHLPLQIAAGVDHLLDVLHHARPATAPVQHPEEVVVPDTAVLDDLRHAVGKGGVGQGVQAVRVDEHPAGLPEGPGQVFSRLQIDGHFSAHGGVHLGQEGGGDLNKVHPPEDGGGGEARQVPHDPAPQGHNRVGAGEAEGHHVLPQLDELMGIFGCLPGGDHLCFHLKPGAGEAVPGLRTGAPRWSR